MDSVDLDNLFKTMEVVPYLMQQERELRDPSPINEDGVPIRKLFVSNLADRTTTRDLEELFSVFGKIDSCYLKRTHGKSSFGFITYSDAESAVEARKAAYYSTIHLHRRILKVLSADPWHQPDSIENKKRFLVLKKNNLDNSKSDEELSEPITNLDSPINVLNDDCLVKIFLYLPIADRVRMERVCKRWQILSQESWRAVKRLDLETKTWGLASKYSFPLVNTNTLRKVLIRCGQYLTHLNLSKSPHILSSSTITIVGKFCPKLQFIDITALELSPSGINSLMTNCLNIKKFVMKSLSGPCEKALSDFFSLNTNLRHLGIEGDHHITGKCLKYLHENKIEELHFKRCNSLLSTYLNDAIERFINLQSLTINSCTCITDETLQVIGKNKLIKNLEFSAIYPLISVHVMYPIADLVNLQWLNLQRNYAVTDDLLIRISMHCKQLNFLDISFCDNISNIGISSLVSLLKLETLKMICLDKVTDEALTDLRGLKQLECQRCTKIEDTGIMNFIRIANNLEFLNVSKCSISNLTLETAVTVTKRRTNNKILKIIIGETNTNVSNLSEVSPLLQIVNVYIG
ncbi:putative RNA-binding protein EEED8.10 [Chelonus insularis]|uniref:putative RNA-binding protein EEED8.10 n=1 Tax=Chelonus insularis TaxID=460826 RepID=UPI001589D2AD|nr:putative RNA-binding protein EEED8.10 [Chelonus insularis]